MFYSPAKAPQILTRQRHLHGRDGGVEHTRHHRELVHLLRLANVREDPDHLLLREPLLVASEDGREGSLGVQPRTLLEQRPGAPRERHAVLAKPERGRVMIIKFVLHAHWGVFLPL